MQKTIQELWEQSRSLLPIESFPEREEEILRIFLDVLDIQRHELGLHRNNTLNPLQQQRFDDIITQRQTHKPLAYILGYQYFYGEKFPVSSETLIPRYDTEVLVDCIHKQFPSNSSIKIIDICTGTGVIALTLAKLFPNATIHGTDIVSKPFSKSQEWLDMKDDRISFEKNDFLDSSTWDGEWDCIVSNPPYLDEQDMVKIDKQVYDFEPHSALYAEEGGLIFYKNIALFAQNHLKNNGFIFLEIDHKFEKIISFFDTKLYSSPKIITDLQSLPRVLVLQKVSSS